MKLNLTNFLRNSLIVFLNLLFFVGYAQPSYTFTDTGSTPISPPVNFGSQEVLLTAELNFLINNTTTGFVPLEISNIQVEANGFPDYSTYWSIAVEDDLGNPIDFSSSATSNFPLHVQVVFSPLIDAPTSIPMLANLRISSNADGNNENLVSLSGEATKTVINYSLVLDRSGSMMANEPDGIGGMKRRIDLLSEAADYFLSLEYLRVEDVATGFPGDRIGIVKYDHEVDAMYLPVSTATNTLLSDTQSNLVSTSATNDVAFIQPRGATATGDAVIQSINTQLTTVASGDEQNVIILISDGYENTGSLISDPGAGSVSNEIILRPDINIYSIGMGAANMASLDQYSALSGLSTAQSFYYDPTLDPMALTNFFFKIYQNAIGLSSIIDPTYYVNLTDTAWVQITDAWISSSDQQITISISYPEDVGDAIDFRIIKSTGDFLGEGSSNGLTTQKVVGRNHIIYQVTFADNADPADYVGQWTLEGRNSNAANSIDEERTDSSNNENTPNLTSVPVGFAIASLSSLTMDVDAGTAGNNQPGEELLVTTSVEDSSTSDNENVEVEDVEVIITTPDGKEVTCSPVKNECNGTYITRYPNTLKKGIYTVYAKATIKNSKGERVSRDAFRNVVISNQKEILSAENLADVNDWFITLFIIIIILLILIMILLVLFRNKKIA